MPLTFADPKDYEKIEQQDRIERDRAQQFGSGQTGQVTMHKADGKNADHPGEP